MKKNFFKFLLLGVFTLSLGAGFVGCKDYDDDIDDLYAKIAAIDMSQIDAIKTQAKEAYDKAVAASDAVAAAVAKAKEEAAKEVEAQIKAALAENGSISQEIAKQISAGLENLGIDPDAVAALGTTDKALAIAQLTMQAKAIELYELPEGVDKAAALKVVNDALAAVKAGTLLPKDVDWATINEYVSALAPGLVTPGGGLVLTTLVFEPMVWTDAGGRAMAFNNLSYFAVNAAYEDNGNHKAATKATTVSQEPIVNYVMNSKAVKESSIKTGELTFAYKEVATRGLVGNDLPKATYVGINNGNLQVKVTAPAHLFWHNNDNFPDSLDIVQLQVPLAGSDEIVSSDWAILYRRDLPKIQIAHTGKNTNNYYDTKNEYTNDASDAGYDATLLSGNGQYFYTPNYWQATDYEVQYQPDPTLFNWYPDTVLAYQGTLDLKGIVKAAKAELEYTGPTATYINGDAFEINTNQQTPNTSPYQSAGDDYPYGYVTANTDWSENVNIEELGFVWKFEVINYMITNTPQHQFVELQADGTTLKSKVFDTEGTAAIGRTPVIRASIIDPSNKNAIVAVGYIKLQIIGTPAEDASVVIPFGEVPFACGDMFEVTVQMMNELVYNALNTTKEDFHRDYTFDGSVDGSNPANAVGMITQKVDYGIPGSGSSSTTYTLEWDVTAANLWANVGKEISQIAVYRAGTGNAKVNIKLTATIKAPNVAINTKDIYPSIWTTDKVYFNQNTAVPTSPANDRFRFDNTFVNNVYGGFLVYNQNGTTAATAGQIKGHHNWAAIAADYATFQSFYDGLDVTYYFTETNEGKKIYGGKEYEFSRSADNLTLLVKSGSNWLPVASLGAEDPAGTNYTNMFVPRFTKGIGSTPTPTPDTWPSTEPNLIPANNFDQDHFRMRYWGFPRTGLTGVDNAGNATAPYAGFDYSSTLALELLNTNEFVAEIGTLAYACGDRTLEVPVGGDKAIFMVKYIKPVYTEKNDVGYWVDAVDGGSKVKVLDVIKFHDWRPQYFEKWTTGNTPVNQNAHLYDFYGIDLTTIAIDVTKATIEPADGTGFPVPLQNANVAVEVGAEIPDYLYHNVSFVYKNMGSRIDEDQLIKFPATLEYNWGTLNINVEIVVHPANWTPAP